MTLGKKLREARKNAGMTQEQFADKIMVSRPAIAKWESDKGIPDIENLKAISKVLDVSIDYLVCDEHEIDMNVIRESINLSQYGKGRKKGKKDQIVRDKFPNCRISTLITEKVLTKGEKVTDNVIGFLTDAPFGLPQLIHGLKMVNEEYYLAEKENMQFIVKVTDDFIETRRMIANAVNKKGYSFVIGDLRFINCGSICDAK